MSGDVEPSWPVQKGIIFQVHLPNLALISFFLEHTKIILVVYLLGLKAAKIAKTLFRV